MGGAMGKNGVNFLDALPSQGTLHIVMLGLDSAGKTTALYRLKFDQYLNTVPTIGFNCEKVQGVLGKAKGIQFLVWDVGGQEKLRPLWRSYTRCTDGILFVVDSVDVERMEEAKMELMRTAKCPDNQGVPVLILANKQDLPGARNAKELETLLGLHELLYPVIYTQNIKSSSSSTGKMVCSSSTSSMNTFGKSMTPTSQHNKIFSNSGESSNQPTESTSTAAVGGIRSEQQEYEIGDGISNTSYIYTSFLSAARDKNVLSCESSPPSVVTTPTATTINTLYPPKRTNKAIGYSAATHQFKGWYIQPACAITGEGLQEGLEVLYEMILKRRKLNKIFKKKR
ncbi:ADP-ribosylation factor-like protein 4C isoform X2 [Zeugodacus cucurbitae]|uniref:ADP-ribosylation factor-like protein 11 n=1 Tax=Zeugodacus cucurbitae TaxID=28588 RepID=A0A0A1X2M7_ZEUCU|nr:ADP-ribosylation factor-like protein 4C isoform X2 [Zeugodacus cucurbitae]